jgi:hypothetical protein
VGIFNTLRKKRGQRVVTLPQQAVIIRLDGANLPGSVYQSFDLNTLEDPIVRAIGGTGLGEYDGNETGPEGTLLYLYGPDAEKLHERISNILTAYPLCKSAVVTIRMGPPGATQRQVTIP